MLSDTSLLRHLPRVQRVFIAFLSFFASLSFFWVRDVLHNGAINATFAALLIGVPAGLAFFVIYRVASYRY